jgi:pimeloyl-ACP methyl ester carboxylesterase
VALRTRRSVGVLVLAGLLAACSGGSGGSGRSDESGAAGDESAAGGEQQAQEFDGGDFYAAPDPVPDDEHGALAARELPDADVGDQLSIFGYSQGGHGALFAGQLAADWAPDYELVGTVAGAPATELPIIFGAAGSLPIAGFLYMIIAGFAEAYPEADPSLVLTPAGESELPQVDRGCVSDVIGHFAGAPNAELLKPGLADVEPWADLETANDPGRVATYSPILVVHSAADDVVPAALSQVLVRRMCAEGQVVERRVYDKGQSHVQAVPDAVSDAFEWLQQWAAGDKPVSTCTG